MLRVTIEVVPFGDEEHKRTIGTITLARQTLAGDPCDYKCVADFDINDAPIAFIIKDHRYNDGAYALIRKALEFLARREEVEAEQ